MRQRDKPRRRSSSRNLWPVLRNSSRQRGRRRIPTTAAIRRQPTRQLSRRMRGVDRERTADCGCDHSRQSKQFHPGIRHTVAGRGHRRRDQGSRQTHTRVGRQYDRGGAGFRRQHAGQTSAGSRQNREHAEQAGRCKQGSAKRTSRRSGRLPASARSNQRQHARRCQPALPLQPLRSRHRTPTLPPLPRRTLPTPPMHKLLQPA
jgi:hypothetical protein